MKAMQNEQNKRTEDNPPFAVAPLLGAGTGPCRCGDAYSIEPHGPGVHVLYLGRCPHRHGLNLARLTELDVPRLAAMLRKLNAPEPEAPNGCKLSDVTGRGAPRNQNRRGSPCDVRSSAGLGVGSVDASPAGENGSDLPKSERWPAKSKALPTTRKGERDLWPGE